jgi:hypothetical protein
MRIPIILISLLIATGSVVSAVPDWSVIHQNRGMMGGGLGQSASEIPGDLVITLQRTPCFGTCPSYSVTLYGNGSYVFNGTRCVMVKGLRKGTITRVSVKRLVMEFGAANFSHLRDSYEDMVITDMPSAILSFTANGTTKTVFHYHGDLNAPGNLSTLEDRVDSAVNSKRFIGSRKDMRCMSE